MAVPPVAPHQSCVSCFKGDTTTGFALRGEAEWIIAALHKLTGMSIEEAQATLLVFCEQELGCDPGNVVGGEMTTVFRFCQACGQKTGVAVADVASGEVPGYGQDDA